MSETPFEPKQESVEAPLREADEHGWRRDHIGNIAWAFILIWAGLVFLAENLGWLKLSTGRFLPPGMEIWHPQAWPLIFLGAGGIILVEVAVRVLIPAYRSPVGGSLVAAVVFLMLGLTSLFGWSWNLIWPVLIIAGGVSMLLRGFRRS